MKYLLLFLVALGVAAGITVFVFKPSLAAGPTLWTCELRQNSNHTGSGVTWGNLLRPIHLNEEQSHYMAERPAAQGGTVYTPWNNFKSIRCSRP